MVRQIQNFVDASWSNEKMLKCLSECSLDGIEILKGERPVELLRGKNMLRIMVKENGLEQIWILQGGLNRQSIPELVSNWQASRDRPSALRCTVDLNEVTSIDKNGEEVLSMMIHAGAKFVANGLYTRHLLEALRARIANREYPA